MKLRSCSSSENNLRMKSVNSELNDNHSKEISLLSMRRGRSTAADFHLWYYFYNHNNDFLTSIRVRKLSNFQKSLLVLIKLRLNLDYVDVGYRFNIKPATVSSIFKRTIICLEYSFSYSIHWPSREGQSASMPCCFRAKFGDRVSVIIDCFEIKTQTPSLTRAKVEAF